MNKEQIIRKTIRPDCIAIYDPILVDVPFAEVFKAMDEYAKQQSMSFAYWTQMEGYYASMSDFGIWGTLKPDCNTRWTTEEIYNQFIEQQQGNDKSNSER